jgi:rod shape-determining protein MreC
MRNLWIFISKYNAFFLFITFLSVSFYLLIKNNSYQRASIWNSSNQVVGLVYERVNQFTSYLVLGRANDSLAAENARLRNQLKTSFFDTKIKQKSVVDSISQQQYTYIEARVINNSVHQKNNYITINRGEKQGIKKGMGVISSSGIVGIVLNVSEHYATIQSLLHSDTRISVSVKNNIGSLVWGDGNYNPRIAILKDIPNHVRIKEGDSVVTSGFSLFPAGIEIGKVIRTDVKSGDSFLNIEVNLTTDFATLQYVNVVNNLLSREQQLLEAQNKAE